MKRTLAIATLLHPCFKSYDFIESFDLIDESDKEWARRELRTEWSTVWKPRPPADDAATSTTKACCRLRAGPKSWIKYWKNYAHP